MRLNSFLLIPALLILLSAQSRAEDETVSLTDPAALQAIPRVPTMATIVADGNPGLQRRVWAQSLIKKKETKARIEVVLLKKKLLEEAEAASVEDKEKQRRLDKYNNSFRKDGEVALPSASAGTKRRPMMLKLEFQVPEIDSYKRLINALKIRSALADNIVETLTKLDRDADGKLTSDEYRDSALIFLSTQRLFHSIDNDDDGQFSMNEMDASRTLPANGLAAITAGSTTKEANSGVYKIKNFDANADGILSVAERKAMSSAYLDISLKAMQDADAYQKLVDDLQTLRQEAALKFERISVDGESK